MHAVAELSLHGYHTRSLATIGLPKPLKSGLEIHFGAEVLSEWPACDPVYGFLVDLDTLFKLILQLKLPALVFS